MDKRTVDMYVISKREKNNEASFLTDIDLRIGDCYDYKLNTISQRSIPIYGKLEDAMLFASLEFAMCEIATLGIELSALAMRVTVEVCK